jgi:hypothetical protein
MSERIEVGDLVMRIHECCDVITEIHMGIPRRVLTIEQTTSLCVCCSTEYTGVHCQLEGEPEDTIAPRSWLKKIPPLTEPESIDEREPVMVEK